MLWFQEGLQPSLSAGGGKHATGPPNYAPTGKEVEVLGMGSHTCKLGQGLVQPRGSQPSFLPSSASLRVKASVHRPWSWNYQEMPEVIEMHAGSSANLMGSWGCLHSGSLPFFHASGSTDLPGQDSRLPPLYRMTPLGLWSPGEKLRKGKEQKALLKPRVIRSVIKEPLEEPDSSILIHSYRLQRYAAYQQLASIQNSPGAPLRK